MSLTVLSLFDGISVGQLAFKDCGIDVDTYYASEINDYAICITQTNFPNTIQLGNVENWMTWDNVDWNKIDIIIGGSPCQDISFAGKRQGLQGKRSSLFYVYRDILNFMKEIRPDVLFLLENVKGKKETLDTISKELGVNPVRINSNLVSAQNRDRYYWTNINDGNIEQPDDKKILLKDILDESADGTFPLSKVHYNAFLKSYPNWKPSEREGKSKPILATYYKQPPHCPYIPDSKSESGFRRLTPLECERCQTLPDNYTNIEGISNMRRYETVGNAWTMKVISHIFSYIAQE